jgi:hypothetical protein
MYTSDIQCYASYISMYNGKRATLLTLNLSKNGTKRYNHLGYTYI